MNKRTDSRSSFSCSGVHAFVAGIPLWLPSALELSERIDAQVLATVGAAPVRLFTINPEIAMLAVRDSAFLATLQRAEWSLVDGSGIAVGLRLRALLRRASRLPRGDLRRPGADLIWNLASACSKANRALLIVGGHPERLCKAVTRLRTTFPGLVVDGVAPSFRQSPVPVEQSRIEALIHGLRPAVVVACLGAPKQERWIESSLDVLRRADVRIAAGLGGTVDFLSGDIPRAPMLVRRIGFEWLYRLWVEPHRWRRQVRALPAFAVRSLAQPGFIAFADTRGE